MESSPPFIGPIWIARYSDTLATCSQCGTEKFLRGNMVGEDYTCRNCGHRGVIKVVKEDDEQTEP